MMEVVYSVKKWKLIMKKLIFLVCLWASAMPAWGQKLNELPVSGSATNAVRLVGTLPSGGAFTTYTWSLVTLGNYFLAFVDSGQIYKRDSGVTYLTPHEGAALIPATLPPSGTAGGDLAGTYPNPTVKAGAITDAKVSASAAIGYSKLNLGGSIALSDLSATGTPTSLKFLRGDYTWAVPPGLSGSPAGGDLAGTYPNPILGTAGTAGTFGDATHIPTITTDAKGRVIVVTTNTFTATPTGSAGGDLAGTYPNPTLLRQLAPTAVKTTTYAAAINDFIPCDNTSGSFTVTLPTTPADKSIIGVKLVTLSGTNTISVVCGGSDIYNKAGGSATLTLTIANQAAILQYKSSTGIWYVISTDVPTSAMMLRDINGNSAVNNIIEAYQTIVKAAGTTTATVASPYQTYFTGSTTQTYQLPVASTLVLGQQYQVINSSSGIVTVNSSGGNSVLSMHGGTSAVFTCILTSGTTAASWSVSYSVPQGLVDVVTGTSYTLVPSDNGIIKAFTNASAIALTVPTGLGATFNGTYQQRGSGNITPTASGTTLRAGVSGTTKSNTQYSQFSINPTGVTDEYIYQGNMQ
jgi:hypothetical protein